MIALKNDYKFKQQTIGQISHLTEMGSTHNTDTECSSKARTKSTRVLGTHANRLRLNMSDILVKYQNLTPYPMALPHRGVKRASTIQYMTGFHEISFFQK